VNLGCPGRHFARSIRLGKREENRLILGEEEKEGDVDHRSQR